MQVSLNVVLVEFEVIAYLLLLCKFLWYSSLVPTIPSA